MRLLLALLVCLALAAPAAAATPRFGLFDLHRDLAGASRNTYGDVQVKPEQKLPASAALVRCGDGCTYGKGFLAFRRGPALGAGDVLGAKAYRIRALAWGVALELTPAGAARWRAYTRQATQQAARRGLPNALVLAVDGRVAGQPFANQVVLKKTTLRIAGLTRWNAVRTAKTFR